MLKYEKFIVKNISRIAFQDWKCNWCIDCRIANTYCIFIQLRLDSFVMINDLLCKVSFLFLKKHNDFVILGISELRNCLKKQQK